jgi:hypothetical protein
MAFNFRDLDDAARRFSTARRHATIVEARSAGRKTAFLSHSHLDQEKAKGLQVLLAEAGWDVFIDWEHNVLDERPNRDTARWLQSAIQACDWLFYLATANSAKSRWCPWEIGYADGKKDLRAIVVISTSDGSSTYGSEYLDLYRQISPTTGGQGLALFEARRSDGGRLLKGLATSPSLT